MTTSGCTTTWLEGSGKVSVSGPGPMRVLLGNARDVHVEYDGEAFDYRPFVNRGIARFHVGGGGQTFAPQPVAREAEDGPNRAPERIEPVAEEAQDRPNRAPERIPVAGVAQDGPNRASERVTDTTPTQLFSSPVSPGE